MPKSINVICIGPSPSVCGGMSRIIELVRCGLPDSIRYRMVPTYSSYTGSEEPDRGSKFVQAVVFLWALMRVCCAGVLSRSVVFHVHLSQKGSTLRKGLVCTLLRLLRCRYIVHCHAAVDTPFHNWVPAAVREVLIWGLGGAKYIVALTQMWSGYYLQLLKCDPDRIVVLPNPVVLPISIPAREMRREVKFLFLGRIGERKGAHDLIRAFAALPNEVRRNCRLTLAGDGDIDGARELAKEMGCEAETMVYGWRGREEVERLLALADVFVLPSRGEGMSAAVLEAMAWGLAIISSAAGGASEFLEQGQNSLLVQPGDTQGLTNAIYKLAGDAALRDRLGKNARKSASGFSLDKYILRLVCLYKETALTRRKRDEIVWRMRKSVNIERD